MSNMAYARNEGIPAYVITAARANHIDIALLVALCTVESACKASAKHSNDGTPAQKEAGIKVTSYGLFQIQPDTAAMVGFIRTETTVVTTTMRGKRKIKHTKIVNNDEELLDPATNTWFAARLLRRLYNRYHDTNKVISAYNAGHAIQSNKDYVLKVLKNFIHFKVDLRYG